MKRLIAIIITACLICSLSACSLGKKELKFRDLSFGTKYVDAIEQIEKDLGKYYSVTDNQDSVLLKFVNPANVAGIVFKVEMEFKKPIPNCDKEESYFAEGRYIYEESHKLPYSTEFIYNNGLDKPHIISDDNFRDLLSKLNELYGNYSKTTTKLGRDVYIWDNFKNGEVLELSGIEKYSALDNSITTSMSIVYKSAEQTPTPTPAPTKNTSKDGL